MSAPAMITARDGESLAVRHWAAVGEARASLLIITGLGEHGGRYERAAGLFAASGLDTWTLDLRGFGASGGRRAYVERLEVWLDDVADRLTAMRALGRPVVLLGHSMGGLVVARYAETDRPQPDLLVLSAPALVGNVPAWKQALARVLGRLAPTVAVKNGLDGSILSRDPAVGVDYVADPLNVHSTTARLGAVLLEAQAPTIADLVRIRVPTLVVHGGADHLVPTVSTEIFGTLPGVERRVFPGLAHETFNEPEGPQVVGEVATWIGERLPAAGMTASSRLT
jgi:alpha-beta hydrolase superfamily lysophospholipase